MSVLSSHHRKLNEKGEGKCSVPMWIMGMPAGFCDNTAYSEETEEHKKWMEMRGEFQYVPALACPAHGGLTKKQAVNLCANCKKNIAECDGNPKFGTGIGNDNVYECDGFVF
jgi:hypothetical protein